MKSFQEMSYIFAINYIVLSAIDLRRRGVTQRQQSICLIRLYIENAQKKD